MKPLSHTHTLILAELVWTEEVTNETPDDVIHDLMSRCDLLADDLFNPIGAKISSRLADTGILKIICSIADAAPGSAALLMEQCDELVSEAHLRLRIVIHAADASETSMGSAADVRHAIMLLRAAQPGQILISAQAHQSAIGTGKLAFIVRDLGQHQLSDLSDPAHVFQLMPADSPHVFPPIASLNGAKHNLVTPVTRFIGRDDDINQIRQELAAYSLVTLTGAPGIGKTRLAVQVAASLVSSQRDGVWFIDVPRLPDSSLVVPAIAAALKVREDPTISLQESVVQALEQKQALLILDNCDLVQTGCAAIGELLLQRCPYVSILATGQHKLGAAGEMEHPVRPLYVPDGSATPSPSTIRGSEAGELFNDAAAVANPEFVLTYSNARAVSKLVNSAAGIPFALQAAAHAIKILEVEPMSKSLEERINRIPDDPEARSYLVSRAVVQWCFDQVDTACRDVLNRLSVMIGPFTQAAMQAVAPGGLESKRINDAPPTLDRLVFAGLVTVRHQSGVPRYRLPDAVRECAAEQLEPAERARARKRFAEYYLKMAEEACADLEATGAARMALWLEKEYANLCAALAWCNEDPENNATGVRLAQALRKYWEARGYPGEGQALLLSSAVWGDRTERTIARADALKKAGDTALQSGNLVAARARHQESLAINRELGDAARQAINLNHLGNIARTEGDHAEALQLHEQALELNRAVGDKRREAVNLHNIGNAHRDLGDISSAEKGYAAALELNQGLSEHLAMGHNLNSMARLSFMREDRTEALQRYEEALTHFRIAGSQPWVAHNLAEIEKLNLRSTPRDRAAV